MLAAKGSPEDFLQTRTVDAEVRRAKARTVSFTQAHGMCGDPLARPPVSPYQLGRNGRGFRNRPEKAEPIELPSCIRRKRDSRAYLAQLRRLLEDLRDYSPLAECQSEYEPSDSSSNDRDVHRPLRHQSSVRRAAVALFGPLGHATSALEVSQDRRRSTLPLPARPGRVFSLDPTSTPVSGRPSSSRRKPAPRSRTACLRVAWPRTCPWPRPRSAPAACRAPGSARC